MSVSAGPLFLLNADSDRKRGEGGVGSREMEIRVPQALPFGFIKRRQRSSN